VVAGGRVPAMLALVASGFNPGMGSRQGVAMPDSATRRAAPATCVDAEHWRWAPVTPISGSLFRITARDPVLHRGVVASAQVAGEPVHFGAVADTSALAAVPIDSAGGVTLQWTCRDGQRGSVRIPTRAGSYPLERLRVAPKFSAPPDSALARRMRHETERASAVSRASHDTPQLWTERFAVPRAARITSGFGGGRTFNGTVTSRHMGTDYAGVVGAPVRATNRGIVRLVASFYLGGNVIYIDHGRGLVSAYLHLSRQLVAEGDTVARGAVIGHVGATGRVTGPHLHFIARYGGITVDPASLYAVP